MLKTCAIIFLLGLLLQGCGGESGNTTTVGTGNGSSVTKYVDIEAGVTCWIVFDVGLSGSGPKGIDCMPIRDTLLNGDK